METNSKISIPWVEKYRPNSFENIVLNDINKQICSNIIEMKYFPHLLFYGPPGTGKTTTIINLVQSYQEKVEEINKDLMIHLNASDDRGIDIIRNQILQFVNSKCLFKSGMKFVILDEVDYMTKNAQQALRQLINNYNTSVRFCLICNYISRIDEGLQTEFLKIRFNNLPQIEVGRFLKNIIINENINITDDKIISIQQMYGSDIRSMINFIQCNHIIDHVEVKIIDSKTWDKLTKLIKNINTDDIKTLQPIIKYLNKTSISYNITFKNIIKDYITYLIKTKSISVNDKFLLFVETLVHSTSTNNNVFIHYALLNFGKFSNLL
jgi:DNA polymerase III delta prime subunit